MIWLGVAYGCGIAAIAIVLGERLRRVRLAKEQLAAMHRRRLGL